VKLQVALVHDARRWRTGFQTFPSTTEAYGDSVSPTPAMDFPTPASEAVPATTISKSPGSPGLAGRGPAPARGGSLPSINLRRRQAC
jgi:hypothetical protein